MPRDGAFMKSQKSILVSLLLLAALCAPLFAACAPSTPCAYGQGLCASDTDCVPGLACTGGKCNQPAGVCTNLPPAWQNPAVTSPPGSPGKSPYNAVILQQQGAAGAAVGASSGIYRQGWFSDWNTLGLIGAMISILIISVAAMVGQAFNLPEVKAFAQSEIMQAVVSVLLIAGLLGIVAFLNAVAIEAVDYMKLPVSCNPAEPCYMSAARGYLDNVYDVAGQYSDNNLKESYERMRMAMRGANVQFNVIWAAFAGASIRWNAGETIQAERAGALFEATAKLMASIWAQRYFLDVISFGIAPVLLLFGIVLRTFFFTRKLGGLLLAIAISLFIVYPLTFSFAWFTLNVTVYGERSIGTADPACPAECMSRYPVAFYSDGAGKLVKFETTQDILRAGITTSNWATGFDANGDGANEYQGLVACRGLSAIFPTSTPPNSCPDCPDFCREVPFPAGIPGCSIAKCASCNPGCKVMRQRDDCPVMCSQGSCSKECLVTQPVENKCFYLQNDAGPPTTFSANLSVGCGNCAACPNWCRMLYRNSSGGYVLANKNEDPCKIAACQPQDATHPLGCPVQCMYVSGILGQDNTCDALCTDPDTGQKCPSYCRIQDMPLLSDYDTGWPTVSSICNGSAKKACGTCPNACKIQILPEDDSIYNTALCAPYPRIGATALNCTMCPTYCRFTTFADYSGFSNIQTMNSPTLPSTCAPDALLGFNCTSPGACDGPGCKAASTAPLCLPYDPSKTPLTAKFCNGCPVELRGIILHHVNKTGWEFTGGPRLTPDFTLQCLDSLCAAQCKPVRTLEIPRESANPICKDYNASGIQPNCELCPYDCRVSLANPGWLDPVCNTPACSAASCDGACKVDVAAQAPAPPPPSCLAYKGNGAVDYPSLTCIGPGQCPSYTAKSCDGDVPACRTPPQTGSQAACEAVSGCSWGLHDCIAQSACTVDYPRTCIGPLTASPPCGDYSDEASCTDAYPASQGCSWDYPWSAQAVKIVQRSSPYDNASACQQCPENCRIVLSNGTVYEGDCGFTKGGSPDYVDCRAASCPLSCRAQVPIATAAPPALMQCQPSNLALKTCINCPAFCRRSPNSLPPGDPAYCDPAYCGADKCIADCRLPDPPAKMCEDCTECPTDCLYLPSTRSDCTEKCSEEALAGPINTGPQDFIKKLPGAYGKEDVKGIGVLMLPALVLPLFGIVIVLSFIHVLSPILGGDMEIPGIGRII